MYITACHAGSTGVRNATLGVSIVGTGNGGTFGITVKVVD